jgi:anti-sigma-K factor RskA
MSAPSLNTLLANAVADLAVAGDFHAQKASQARQASSEETDALNRVNEAQKKFDELVAMVKKEAPRASDWKQSKGVPAP